MARHRWSRRGGLSCPQVVELLTDWLEGGLDAATSARVQEHLAACEGCTAYVAQLRATVGALAGLPAPQPPPELQADLVRAFREWAS